MNADQEKIVSEIRVLGFLKLYLREGGIGADNRLTLPRGAIVEEVYRRLKLPKKAVDSIMLIMLNNVQVGKEQVLAHDDVLTLVPIAAGG